jgi:hypothetical protein
MCLTELFGFVETRLNGILFPDVSVYCTVHSEKIEPTNSMEQNSLEADGCSATQEIPHFFFCKSLPLDYPEPD